MHLIFLMADSIYYLIFKAIYHYIAYVISCNNEMKQKEW